MGWVVNSTPRPLYPGEETRYLIVQETGWTPGSAWTRAENFAPPPVFDPLTVQRVASRYTDWAILSHRILLQSRIMEDGVLLLFWIYNSFSVAGPGHLGYWCLGVDGEGHVQQPESADQHCARPCLHTDINRWESATLIFHPQYNMACDYLGMLWDHRGLYLSH
jgi:hypothetical protein